MPRVNPRILRWARETAGLSLETAAKKIQLDATKAQSGAERLAALEEAEGSEPSRKLLLRMAKQYRRPLLIFYMSSPPKTGDRGQDFRTLPAKELGAAAPGGPSAQNALLDSLIRDVIARQGIVRSALEDEDEARPLAFVGAITMSDGKAAAVALLRETLNLRLDELRSQPNTEDAFSVLRDHAESAGVFVLLQGDLGNYHSAIALETFRGFALADKIAPFIVINDQDSKAAWSFTLLHEFVHLFLGQTGVGALDAELAVEQFCNDVASEFLLPSDELLEYKATTLAGAVEWIGQFAGARNLSRSMVAYRLYRSGSINHSTWNRLKDTFHALWLQEKTRQRERTQPGDGPSYYVVRRHRLGKALTGLVGRMIEGGTLTTTKAAIVLGVKPRQVDALLGGSGHPRARLA